MLIGIAVIPGKVTYETHKYFKLNKTYRNKYGIIISSNTFLLN